MELVPLSNTVEKKEHDPGQYQELFQGDVWELRHADGTFVEAYALDTIHRAGKNLKVVALQLGPDLAVPRHAKNADDILESRSDARLIEDFRQELKDNGYRRVTQGIVSERSIVPPESVAVPLLSLPMKPGETMDFFRQTQFFDDREDGGAIEEMEIKCVDSLVGPMYQIINTTVPSVDQAHVTNKYYRSRDLLGLIHENGWVPLGVEGVEVLPNAGIIPEHFAKDLDAKKAEKRFWTKELLLSEILPGETCVIKNVKFGGGERIYRREGDELISALSKKAETQDVTKRLNHGWELVEKPEDDVLAGTERAQFLTENGAEGGVLYTVEKRLDGYYILQNEDDWQGPLTKGAVRARSQAEHWTRVSERNTVEDFLHEDGAAAAETVRAYEQIFTDARHHFQQQLVIAEKRFSPEQIKLFRKQWSEMIVPRIMGKMKDDLIAHDGFFEKQAEKIIGELYTNIAHLT
ncbi:MAG: hypothetical protein KBA91_01245 [Candidatus Moranbacteria bacterium]|jgi:hypothetical protein|nr:hypothetical protein [Candidatus Moranbacteria bacterium]